MINKKAHLLALATTIFAINANASTITKNTAKFQAMNKITGTVNVLEITVNSQAKYEDFSIVVRKCQTNPPEETPESYAFVDIAETTQQKETNIYKGWMLSSSPALNPLEHPMYDLWLLECTDKDINEQVLLSQEDLLIRDELPTIQELSKIPQKDDDAKEEKEEMPLEDSTASKPQSLIENIETNIKFNAIEEEKKQKELEEQNKEALELLENKPESKEKPQEMVVEEAIETPQETVFEEAKIEDNNKKQLIDFSNIDI